MYVSLILNPHLRKIVLNIVTLYIYKYINILKMRKLINKKHSVHKIIPIKNSMISILE